MQAMGNVLQSFGQGCGARQRYSCRPAGEDVKGLEGKSTRVILGQVCFCDRASVKGTLMQDNKHSQDNVPLGTVT